MQRMLPASLFGRIALVLFIGLLITQVGSALISDRERYQLLRESAQQRELVRMEAVVKLLDSLSSSERARARAHWQSDRSQKLSPSKSAPSALSDQPLQLNLVDQPPVSGGTEEHEMAKQLAALVGPNHPVQAWSMPDEDMLHFAVRLHDGSWLLMDYRPPAPFGWSESLLWRLGLLLMVTVGLTLLATRAALRPIEQFTKAAEHLGGNLDAPPLAENGTIEVRRGVRTLNSMQERIRESVAERTRLLIAISHDLKTPLTRLRLRAEFIREDPELRATLQQEVDIMQAMTGATLDLLRGGEGEPVRNVDINTLVEGLVADTADLSGMHITIHGRALAPYPARSLMLKRALANLIENARKYAGGEIRIAVQDDTTSLAITVSDHGPGIPEQEQARMLEPYQRLEPSRNLSTGGTGLGLSIARSFARVHGGDLNLWNRAEGGLDVQIKLPRCP
ncbi:MAG: hypothetical protein A2X75_02530 [Gallionellales bacterium GWE2_58_10]|nr:MAG: hypothetical protein A2X75_02530 [Gallionellales bacterium GWE2_58_10]OGT17991.1 MAG: hypothetical protein A3J49_18260 [Gallionellales bacterium RIFCSPHIGHO2_02_FULL_57_16]